MSRSRPRRLQLTALLVCAVLAGCRSERTSRAPQSGPSRLMSPEELSDAERRYGRSAYRDPKVTLQPDVVLLPAGAASFRSAGAEGFIWTLDAGAEGVEDIQPGKILLLTSRVAGRVLGVERTGEGVRVVLGPAELTDFIREGKFEIEQQVGFDQMVDYDVPEIFDPVLPVPPIVAQRPSAPQFLSAAHFRRAGPGQQFKLWPLFGSDGFGLEIVSDVQGAHFLGRAKLYFMLPRLYFNLDIQGGRLVTCIVRITGAGGFALAFESSLPTPGDANIRRARFSPKEYTIPVSGNGVPFGVTVRQAIRLQTAFTSSGAIRTGIHYKLGGDLRAGYQNGQWTLGGPVGPTTVQDLDAFLLAIKGAALGATGIVLVHSASLMVGVGAFGFMTGPYARLNTSITVTRGSDAAIQGCRWGTIVMSVGAGVGYRIPQPVADAINAILSALHIQERIQSAGGIETTPVELVNAGRYAPSTDACKG